MNSNHKIALAATLILLSASTVFGADQTLNNLQSLNTGMQSTVQNGVGGWVKLIIGFLPLVLFFSMAAGTLFFQMKKADQSQDNDFIKIGIWTFAFAFIGAMVGYALDAMIGATLLGSTACGTEVFTGFWKVALGITNSPTFASCS